MYLRPMWLILGLIIELIVIFLYVASVWYYRQTRKFLMKDIISNPVNAPIWELLRDARKKPQTRYKYEAAPSSEERANAHGIIFGIQPDDKLYISPEEEPYHILVVGGTRSGKTTAILIPTLRVWQHTAFVIDISGDISCMIYRDDKVIRPWNSGKPAHIFQRQKPVTTAYSIFYLLQQNHAKNAERQPKQTIHIVPRTADDIPLCNIE